MTLKKNIYPNVQKNVRLIFLHFSDQVHVLLKYITLNLMFIMKLIKRYLMIYTSLVNKRRY